MARIQAQRINMKIYFRLRRICSTRKRIPFEYCDTVYPESIDNIFTKCNSARSHSLENNDCDIIILTPEIKRKIEACIVYKSKLHTYDSSLIATQLKEQYRCSSNT